MNASPPPHDSHTPQKIAMVRAHLLEWFEANRRDLPWRHTRDPYRILISEVMLQQTQVDRVIPYYDRFLSQLPTVEALAAAAVGDVIHLWAGLGYNRRAVNLQRTAQAVVNEHGGHFPESVDALRALPGIGPYTAGAIACFAFEQDAAFIDTNMRRVIHRLFAGPELPEPLLNDREITALAAELVPPGDGWRWNQGLIEFGALQCTARKPACVICPLQQECRAFPDIQAAIASQPRGTRRKQDAPFTGSNRFYRGRTVDILRASRQGVPMSVLGGQLRDDFDDALIPWLVELVEGLERDGLAVIAETPPGYDASESLATSQNTPEIVVKLPD